MLIEEELKLPDSERMQVVSILTPNFLHFPMAKKLLENGFNVICEKPMTTSYQEAKILEDTLQKTEVILAVTYTYTGYPMVRQMREMIANGDLGNIQKIDAQYYQGWINPIIHDKEKRQNTWRLNPEKGGISCCIGDIGTHAFDMIEYVTQLEVEKVLADLNYVYSDNKMDVDGTVLLRCSNNVKGCYSYKSDSYWRRKQFLRYKFTVKKQLKWEQETQITYTF